MKGIMLCIATLEEEREAREFEENSVSVVCPKCKEELFFEKDEEEAECPYCGQSITLNN